MSALAYPNLQGFAAHHRITLTGRFAGPWRLTKPFVGQISGLNNSYGTLTATNGIDCYIERADGTLFMGHMDWFVKDPAHRQPQSSPQEYVAKKAQRKSAAELERLMEEYR